MFSNDVNKWIVIALLILVIIGLVQEKFKASVVFAFSVIVLLVFGIIDVDFFLGSFVNQSLISIFILILITSAVNDNFNIAKWLDKIFKKEDNPRWFIAKMASSVAFLSSFMNNTPIVAIMIPYVYQWGKKRKISPSKLLMPLSFSAILGGVTTVIGTSTNLVLNGFLSANGEETLSLYDFVVPGVLLTVIGVVYMSTIGYQTLPSRHMLLDELQQNIREYLVEAMVKDNSPVCGKTISEAGLRNLEGNYIVEILRGDQVIKPVRPDEILQADDRLYFAGDTSKVVDLVDSEIGICWAKTEKFDLGEQLDLVEVVVPRNSYLIGKTLKQSSFREKYDAAVIAIHRNGERLSGKLGELKLEIGDLLLLTTGIGFTKASQRDKNLYLVSILKEFKNGKSKLGKFFWLYFLFIIGLIFSGVVSFFIGLVLLLAGVFGFRLMNSENFKKNINIDLLIILGSAVTLGGALIQTGASDLIAELFIVISEPFGPLGVQLSLFVLTLIFTTFVTNVAAVSIVFPVAYQIIENLGIDGTPIYLVIAFAASAAFLTPISYQTNLMVYGPGNYRSIDFVRTGAPLMLIYGLTCNLFVYYYYN